MRVLVELWRSTVGRKALVALSGLLLGMWVVLHLIGNLTVFSGAATADRYEAALQQIRAAPCIPASCPAACTTTWCGDCGLHGSRASTSPRPRSLACTSSTACGQPRAVSERDQTRRRHAGAPPWRRCPPRSPSDSRRSPSRCSRGGFDDGPTLRQCAGRAARLPLAAPSRGSRARRPDAPSPPPRPCRGRRAGR